MTAAAAIAHVCETVDYLRVSVGDGGGREWLASADLVEDADTLGTLVRSTAAGRGTDRDDVAMSLFVQAYSFRVASLAIGAWLLDDVTLDVDPANTSIALGRHRPDAVRVAEARAVDSSDRVAGLHEALVDGHLASLVGTAHEACRVGEALLWGNVGAACASSFGAFMAPLPDRHAEIRDRAEAFVAAARPELARSGRLVHVGPLWAWERASCCLWYKTDSGFRCEDCSLWTHDERQARYERALAEVER
jgi:ferric iron reductase protein FhuF